MNKKEVNEIRRRLSPEKHCISKIYGCYVNTNREIISYLEESFGLMPEFEAEKYSSLLKKVLSGTIGKNLIDIVFSTQQVADSDEHRLLSALRNSGLQDREARDCFYQKVIDSLDMDGSNYLILLATDTYDVPTRGKDDELLMDASDTVFTYVLCCVCPVKDGKEELGYDPGENEFHSCTPVQIVGAPELGFLFPAFDDRAANIYDALYYSKNPAQLHQEFIDAIFHVEPPMPASEQKETFQDVLAGALEEDFRFQVVQSVHEQIRERIEQHLESKNPEPLDVTAREIGNILENCGVPEERVQAFQERCSEEFGVGAALNPDNIIDRKRFEIKTPQVRILVDPEFSYLVETRIIDGRKYLLIPSDDRVEINGMEVSASPELPESD
ncbi:MAG: DUF4317 domain-containing protein [Candidatus Merdivicinus sp.]|jgi:hypothetical protein